MIQQYREGLIPSSQTAEEQTLGVQAAVESALKAYGAFKFWRTIRDHLGVVSNADKFIVERAPWKLERWDGQGQQNSMTRSTLRQKHSGSFAFWRTRCSTFD